ncbi:hypothetical protein J7L48_08340 [bacterium]|nr:hypothetical protein [bacterium]
MNLTVNEVKNKKDLKNFIEFPYGLYANYPNWVPPLKSELYALFNDKKNPFFEHAEIKLFIATENGMVVGRIASIIDRKFIEFQEENTGYFGFFEAIDNQRVVNELFEKAEAFLKDNNIESVIGPMNPSTNEECGFLLEGFDSTPLVMMTYTPEYYIRLTENAGYNKVKDLFAFHSKLNEKLPEKVEHIYEKVLKRNKIKLRHMDMKNYKKEIETIKILYNGAWEKNWGFVPMTESETDKMAKDLKDLIVPELVQFAEVGGKTVAFMWTSPDYNYVMKKLKGKLNIFTFLKEKKNIKWVRLITFGILKDYRKMGIDALFFKDALDTAKKMGYTDAEFSWVLEENVLVHRAAKVMGGELYKKYRIVGKDLR